MTSLLLVGRWNAVTRDQEEALRALVWQTEVDKLVFVITGADQSGTKRHPLSAEERMEIVTSLADGLERPYEIHGVEDIPDSARWVEHLREAVSAATDGATRLAPGETILLSANPDVRALFERAGFETLPAEFLGSTPAEALHVMASGGPWRDLASEGTIRVYDAAREKRLRDIYSDVHLNREGELSTGRDFCIYAAGMDASLRNKLEDLVPHVRPGLIVDKGCGTGALLVHLSELFPASRIVGLDLSKELLRVAESHHYPNQNVAIVKGNIILPHFPDGSVTTTIFSSVMHEIYSYTGYDRGQVRLALGNTHRELKRGGRIVIRDGIKPPDRRIAMRCDAETTERFRRFAREFKGVGIRFEERDGLFHLALHDANEFLSKKDYLENWSIEVKEEFGVFTLDEWRQELEAMEYRVVQARSYVNPWILEHRYRGRVRLFDESGGELPFPDTTAVIVAER